MSLRNPICNENERQEMFELIRKRARKETGTALHFGDEVKKEDILFGAIEEAYFYVFNRKDIPVSCPPEYMLSSLIEEVGAENVTVLEKGVDAIKVKLRNHVWWLCRGLFSAYESQMPWQVSHIGVNENASVSFPRPMFPVCMEFEKIIPILDEMFPQIEEVAMAAACDKQNRVRARQMK